jgi:hypothetical protein
MSLEKMNVHRLWIVAVLFGLVMSVVLVVPTASADSHMFDISVYHGINGRSLGLSKDLPVIATVYQDGEMLAELNLEFKDRVKTQLPAGEYLITVESAEVGPLPSMTVGPVDIPAGADVSLHAKLSGGKTPIIKAKIK